MSNLNVTPANAVEILAIELTSRGGLHVNAEEFELYLKFKNTVLEVEELLSTTISRYYVATELGRCIAGHKTSPVGEDAFYYVYADKTIGDVVVDFYAPEHRVVRYMCNYYAFGEDGIIGLVKKDTDSDKLIVHTMTVRTETAFF